MCFSKDLQKTSEVSTFLQVIENTEMHPLTRKRSLARVQPCTIFVLKRINRFHGLISDELRLEQGFDRSLISPRFEVVVKQPGISPTRQPRSDQTSIFIFHSRFSAPHQAQLNSALRLHLPETPVPNSKDPVNGLQAPFPSSRCRLPPDQARFHPGNGVDSALRRSARQARSDVRSRLELFRERRRRRPDRVPGPNTPCHPSACHPVLKKCDKAARRE